LHIRVVSSPLVTIVATQTSFTGAPLTIKSTGESHAIGLYQIISTGM